MAIDNSRLFGQGWSGPKVGGPSLSDAYKSPAGGGLPRIGKMRRQFVKQRFQDMMEGKLVSDQEKRAFEADAMAAAQQAQAAQDLATQRAANVIAQGSPIVAGQMKQDAKGLGDASRKAATEASKQTSQLASGLKDAREGKFLAEGKALIAANKEDVMQGLNFGLKAATSAVGALS
tara:strand:- start:8510 stop:9037 length:528 start_codon:yes stop_codon:yes gene_type:complete